MRIVIRRKRKVRLLRRRPQNKPEANAIRESSVLTRADIGCTMEYMKLTSLVWRSLVGVACMSFVLTAAAAGEKNKTGYREWRGVVYTTVTGSFIPERVVLRNTMVNGASPLTVFQGSELHTNGATSLAGILALDPSMLSSGGHH